MAAWVASGAQVATAAVAVAAVWVTVRLSVWAANRSSGDADRTRREDLEAGVEVWRREQYSWVVENSHHQTVEAMSRRVSIFMALGEGAFPGSVGRFERDAASLKQQDDSETWELREEALVLAAVSAERYRRGPHSRRSIDDRRDVAADAEKWRQVLSRLVDGDYTREKSDTARQQREITQIMDRVDESLVLLGWSGPMRWREQESVGSAGQAGFSTFRSRADDGSVREIHPARTPDGILGLRLVKVTYGRLGRDQRRVSFRIARTGEEITAVLRRWLEDPDEQEGRPTA